MLWAKYFNLVWQESITLRNITQTSLSQNIISSKLLYMCLFGFFILWVPEPEPLGSLKYFQALIIVVPGGRSGYFMVFFDVSFLASVSAGPSPNRRSSLLWFSSCVRWESSVMKKFLQTLGLIPSQEFIVMELRESLPYLLAYFSFMKCYLKCQIVEAK